MKTTYIYNSSNRRTLLQNGTFGVLLLAIVLSALTAAAVPTMLSTPSTQVSAKGGAGNVSGVVLPANYPAGVPLPTGKMLAASTTGTSWTVSLLVPGAYPTVYAATNTLYLNNGFQSSSISENPQFFANDSYNVTVYSRAYDHGPEATEVLVVVSQK